MAPNGNRIESAVSGAREPAPRKGMPADDSIERADRVVLSFPPRPEHVSLARMLAVAIATRAGFDGEAIEDIRLLVSEACTNAVRAHAANAVEAPIQVVCLTDGSFHLEVNDLGGGFEMGVVPPTFPDPDGEAGGYGIPLMHLLAADAAFVTNTEGGTTVKLTVPSDAKVVIEAERPNAD